jgi:hypothetical protein
MNHFLEAPTGRAKLAQGALALGYTDSPTEEPQRGELSEQGISDKKRGD